MGILAGGTTASEPQAILSILDTITEEEKSGLTRSSVRMENSPKSRVNIIVTPKAYV
jgi:hypothetical protein